MITIFTLYTGREIYLRRLRLSLSSCWGGFFNYEHIIIINGCKPPDLTWDPQERVIVQEPQLETGDALNRYVSEARGVYFFKLDDDALLVSTDFSRHLFALLFLLPIPVFSPYPVGLIGTPGGAPSPEHIVRYSSLTDTYYTLRRVQGLGGFARICPTDMLRTMTFPAGHREDPEFSRICRERGTDQYVCENALVVEHQETFLGQRARYRKLDGPAAEA